MMSQKESSMNNKPTYLLLIILINANLAAGSEPVPRRLKYLDFRKFNTNSAPFGIAASATQGDRRTMEDAASRLTRGPCSYYTVLDGHGGAYTSYTAALSLLQNIAIESKTSTHASEAIVKGFQRTDSCLDYERAREVGSTAVVAVVNESNIHVGNAGDSRAVLCSDGIAIPLSNDHTIKNPAEKARVIKAGAFITSRGRIAKTKDGRSLFPTRSLGDFDLRPVVKSEPEITSRPRSSEDEFLILATDGVWDALDNQTAVDVVRPLITGPESSIERAADKLIRQSHCRGSKDNALALAIRLNSSSVDSK